MEKDWTIEEAVARCEEMRDSGGTWSSLPFEEKWAPSTCAEIEQDAAWEVAKALAQVRRAALEAYEEAKRLDCEANAHRQAAGAYFRQAEEEAIQALAQCYLLADKEDAAKAVAESPRWSIWNRIRASAFGWHNPLIPE